VEDNHLKLIADALKTPEGVEKIKSIINSKCSPKICKIMNQVLSSMDSEGNSFEKYASIIREEFTDVYLDDFNNGDITKKELDEKINNLHWTYLQVLDEEISP